MRRGFGLPDDFDDHAELWNALKDLDPTLKGGPLKLNFAVTPERLERLKEAKAFAGLASSRKRIGADQPGNGGAVHGKIYQPILRIRNCRRGGPSKKWKAQNGNW